MVVRGEIAGFQAGRGLEGTVQAVGLPGGPSRPAVPAGSTCRSWWLQWLRESVSQARRCELAFAPWVLLSATHTGTPGRSAATRQLAQGEEVLCACEGSREVKADTRSPSRRQRRGPAGKGVPGARTEAAPGQPAPATAWGAFFLSRPDSQEENLSYLLVFTTICSYFVVSSRPKERVSDL